MAGGSLKPDDPDQEKCHEKQANGAAGFFKKQDSYNNCAQCADAGPDGVGGAKRQSLGGLCQEQETEDHADHCENGEFYHAEALRKLQAGRPEYLQKSGCK